MKFSNDKKLKNEGSFLPDDLNDIRNDGSDCKKTADLKDWGITKIKMDKDEESLLHATAADDLNMDKCRPNFVNNGNKDEEERDEDSNFNLDKKEKEKTMRQLTAELENLCLDVGENGKYELHVKDVEEERATPENSPDDITAAMKGLALRSRSNTKESQHKAVAELHAVKDEFDQMKNLKIEPCHQNSEDLNQNVETIVIMAHPEKKGEENEDLEATHLLSDVDSDQVNSGRCMSLLGRGPTNGIAKEDEMLDLHEVMMMKMNDHHSGYYPPRKYVRPSHEQVNYNPHMCGGRVQVVPPSIQPTSLVDPRHLEGFNLALQYQKHGQPEPLACSNNLSRIFNSYSNISQSSCNNGWPLMPQSKAYYGDGINFEAAYPYAPGGGGFMQNGEFSVGLEKIMSEMFPQIEQGCMPYPFQEQHSPIESYMPQHLTRSPGDQGLTSPGSSSPTYVNSPYSSASVLTNDPDLTDLAAFSPGEFSLSSPDSGISHDLADETSFDLDLAMEIIKEDTEAFIARRNLENVPPIPESIEEINTGADPIGEPILPCSTTSYTTGKPARQPSRQSKKTSKRPQEVARVLPPVTDGTLPATVFQQGFCINPVPTTLQIPYIFVGSTSKPTQIQTSTKPRPIQPKRTAEPSPSTAQSQQTNVQPSALPKFSPPPSLTSSPQEPAVTSVEQDHHRLKAYRAVAGLPNEKLLVQDNDGDIILHLAIVKEETKLVRALLERYVREGLIDSVINLANKQHQTPLCLAVFLNQTEIVQLLIEHKADVNVQLQRKLNCGLMCYRLIHYAAKRGKKWVPTLIQLLSAQNIDLHAFDSEGCTALHCAIKDHGEVHQGLERIDSKETIYHLAKYGADLNHQHGLSGKTPLHYAIEKKDSDLVGWFLGLASYIQSSGVKSVSGSVPEDLVHSLLTAKPSIGINALQLALNIQMDRTERVKILDMLIKYGADVSQKGCDGKLRQELAKYHELAPLPKNGTVAMKNVKKDANIH